ncbi:MAG: type I-E CRISPR-associated protein Cas6/Cse3/CasE [Chloroflexi bacterium]|nr:type I-E CRISPR-associated protein Cas6/Cse3/CasE [Chloroflexota bacterium]
MIYLSRLCLNDTRVCLHWIDNTYRIHQRLAMACEHDPRTLFRLEEYAGRRQLIVQGLVEPDWPAAFASFHVLAGEPQCKMLQLHLVAGQCCRFRLLANPTVKRAGKRLGLLREQDQRAWLERKLNAVGAEALDYIVIPKGFQLAYKSDKEKQKHLAVLYEGVLRTLDPELLTAALEQGIGAAKGFGFGLLSLAPAAA